MTGTNIMVLVVNVAKVPDKAELYKDLLGMNEDFSKEAQ